MNSTNEGSHPVTVLMSGKGESKAVLVPLDLDLDDVALQDLEVLGPVDLLVLVVVVVVIRVGRNALKFIKKVVLLFSQHFDYSIFKAKSSSDAT